MNKLILYTGCDVPFQGDFEIHQPRLGEISKIADENEFFKICRLCCIKKEDFEQASGDASLTNFHIFLGLLIDPRTLEQDKQLMLKFLELLFQAKVSLNKGSLVFTKDEEKFLVLNEENFKLFQNIVKQITGLSKFFSDEEDYNPVGQKAKEIAEKLKKGRQKVAQIKAKEQSNVSFLGNYMTILTAGCHLSINDLNDMTIPQIIMTAERFIAYYNFEVDFRCRMVGGGDNKSSLKNWMEFE